jgi:hypothetical protein
VALLGDLVATMSDEEASNATWCNDDNEVGLRTLAAHSAWRHPFSSPVIAPPCGKKREREEEREEWEAGAGRRERS